jgi:sugar phosphate isomerase/epimerase
MTNELPTIGAALPIAELATYRDWLIDGQRDLEIQDFFDTSVLDGDWKGRVEEAKRLLDGFEGRLGIHGPFINLPIDARDPAIRDVVRKRLDQGLDACEALGATSCVIHSPFSNWDYNNLDRFPDWRENKTRAVHATLGDAVKRAEALGVTFVIENIEDRNPLDRLELARSFNSKAVAVSIDTGHAHYAAGSLGAPPVDYFVNLAGTDLRHVHLQDADGYADRHWAPGLGTVNWKAFFAALNATGATPHLVLELIDKNTIMQGWQFLVDQGLVK